MKKLILLCLLAILIVPVALATRMEYNREGYWANEGVVNYIGDDNLVQTTTRFQMMLAGWYGARGYLTVQGADTDGKRVRLSAKITELDYIQVQIPERTYIHLKGIITYWKQGMKPTKVYTNSIRLDVNKYEETLNIAGGEDTPYPFRVSTMNVWKLMLQYHWY